MRQNVATALQVAGIGCGVAAGLTVALWLGLAIACVGLVALGVAVELK